MPSTIKSTVGQEIAHEIHITGDRSIFYYAQSCGWKTISIDLLTPSKKVLRTEYMTSEIRKYPNLLHCLHDIFSLQMDLKRYSVPVSRVKVECPPYPHLIKHSLYMEAHFPTKDNNYPISRNTNKTTILATDREYDKDLYDDFRIKHADHELELCIFDTNIKEDKDWFDLWDV